MNLGPKPVGEIGSLSVFDSRVPPVPPGYVMVLMGGSRMMELAAGAKTNLGLRSRYPQFAMVSLAVSNIEFSYTHTSDDRREKFVVTMQGDARVIHAAEFVDSHRIDPIGAPLQRNIEGKMKRIAQLHAKSGMEVVREQLAELETELLETPLVMRGVQLVSCNFDVEVDAVSVIIGVLEEQGATAYAGLRFLFPKLSGEVRGWIEDLYAPQKYQRQNVEDNLATIVKIAEALRSQGIDSDELMGIVSISDLSDQVRLSGQAPSQMRLGAAEPRKLERRED